MTILSLSLMEVTIPFQDRLTNSVLNDIHSPHSLPDFPVEDGILPSPSAGPRTQGGGEGGVLMITLETSVFLTQLFALKSKVE